MLTQEAFNALLKTLEEPPPHVIFMFATTEPHKMPPTVLSRCQAFWLQPIPEELIAQKVREIAEKEGFELEEGAAEFLAQRAGGSLRDALVLLEQLGRAGPITPERIERYLGLPPRAQIDAFLDALLGKNSDDALEIVADLSSRGRDLALFAEELLARARDRIVSGEDGFLPLIPALIGLRSQLPRAFSRRLHLELFILEHCGPPKQAQVPKVLVRKSAEIAVPPKDPGFPKTEEAPTPQPFSKKEPGTFSKEEAESPEDPWERLLRAAWERRADLGVFLSPARASYSDGILRIVLPEGYRFHYELLHEKDLKGVLEEVARKFYEPLLAVEIEYAGNDGPRVLTLEEAARLLAEHLEGKIISS